jgi:dienelactone hydrolase
MLAAPALLPVAVHAQGVVTRQISEGTISGELALPAKLPAPAIFVLHTAWGRVHPADAAYARNLAAAGFVAFAINYPNRAKPVWQAEYVRWMRARPEAAGHPFGAVGFSLGGRQVFNLARSPEVKAVVSYYGTYDLTTTPVPQMRYMDPQASPIFNLDKIRAAALLLHGEKDTEVPLEQIERMRQAMLANGLPVEVVIYPGDYHCFDRGPPTPNSDRTQEGTLMVYDAKAAKDAEARTIAWFRKYLV